MIKKLIGFFLVLIFIFSYTSNSVLAAESADNSDYAIIDERNERISKEFGLSYEDIFNFYPASLNTDIEALYIVYESGNEAARTLSDKDITWAAIMEALDNPSVGFEYNFRNTFADFSDYVSTPYEKQLDDLTMEYINYAFENELFVQNSVKKIKKTNKDLKQLYSVEEIQQAFLNDDLNAFIDIYCEGYISKEDIEKIREEVMGKKEFIEISLGDEIDMVEYYIFLLESYRLNYKLIEELRDMLPSDSLLVVGLNRFLSNYSKLFLPQFIDYVMSDVTIGKISDSLIQLELQGLVYSSSMILYDYPLYCSGTWTFITVAIKAAEYVYNRHQPSAKDITRYFIVHSFLDSIETGLYQARNKMNENISKGQCVDRDDINDYEFLYNIKIRTIQFYLECSLDITKTPLFQTEDTNLQTRIKTLQASMKNLYTYDYYIDLCARNAKGETITDMDFPIDEILYKIKENEKLDLFYDNDSKLHCIYTLGDGTVKELGTYNNKLFGGVELSGGSIIAHSDARISFLKVISGSIDLNDDSKITADKINFGSDGNTETAVSITGGELNSIRDIYMSNINIIGNDCIISTNKGIIFNSGQPKYGLAVRINDCNLSSNTGIACGSNNYITNGNIDGDIISGNISLLGTINVSGNISCSLHTKNSDITANSIILNEGEVINSRLTSLNDFSYNYLFQCEGEDSLIKVYGDFYANGYTGGWGALSGTDYRMNSGVLELYGDLVGMPDVDMQSMWGGPFHYSFTPREDFIVKLCGDSKQIIHLPESSGFISNLIIENENIEFNTDIDIGNLYSDLMLSHLETCLTINNAQKHNIIINSDTESTIKITNGIYNQVGEVNGSIQLKDSNCHINGNVNNGISIDNSYCEVDGQLLRSISVKSGTLKQISDKKAEVSYLTLEDGVLEVFGDLTYTNQFSMSGNSSLIIPQSFYAKGYSYSYSTRWGKISSLKGGIINIGKDLIIDPNYQIDKTSYIPLYFEGTSELYFCDGYHVVQNVDSINITNLSSSDNATIHFENESNTINNLNSDITLDNNNKISINKWNGYSVTLTNVTDSSMNYPQDYFKFISSDTNTIYYRKCLSDDIKIKKSENQTQITLYENQMAEVLVNGVEELSINNYDTQIIEVDSNKLTAGNIGESILNISFLDNTSICESKVRVLSKKSYCNEYGHYNIVSEEKIEPTCDSDGYTEGEYCEFCGTVINGIEKIDRIPHIPVKDDAVDPTCKSAGLTEGSHCSVCGNVIVAQEEIPMLSHKEEDIPEVAVSCTVDGMTAGSRCSVCGDYIVEPTVTEKALGHNWEDVEDIEDSTCAKEGKKLCKCSRCGEESEITIPKKPHMIVVDAAVEPTYTATGLTAGTHCSICGEVINAQQVIPVKTKETDIPQDNDKPNDSTTTPSNEANSNTLPKNVTDQDAANTGKQKDSSTNSSKYSNEWINGKWYDINGNQTYTGTLVWKCNTVGWWIEDTDGWYPVSSWQKIDGFWYYFDSLGYMASSEWVDGYWLSSNGALEYEGTASWKSDGTGWWFEDNSGWWASNCWQKINGSWYYFNSSGYMVTNQYVDGYWIGADGVCS